VSGEEMRCDNCRRLVEVRYRKSAGGPWLGWLVIFLGLLGAVAALEGYLVAQLVGMGGLPEWFNQTAVRFMVGSALLSPEGIPGELVEFAGTVTLVNYLLAGLCLLAALGLALRNRIAYFGSLFLAGLLVMITGAGLLVGLTGWLPALFRLGLIAISVKWLIDSAPAFEWQTRLYNADVDGDLRTDLDYYNRGLRYRDMGMWAKTAAHWKVAAQLGPSKAQYRVALANAYVKLGYPQAALAEAERALARTPEDEELRAFRDSLAGLEGVP
jgi:tetratricopeptide (TPR) repeat protein